MNCSFMPNRLYPVFMAGILAGVFTLAVLAGTQLRVWLFGSSNDLLLFIVTFPTIFLFGIGWSGDGSFSDRIFEWVYPPPTDNWFAFLFFGLMNALIVVLLFSFLRTLWRILRALSRFIPTMRQLN